MGNFLSATSHVAASELFLDEMKDIILSENSLNVATPVATEPEQHTDPHFVDELCCVFPEPCFCARWPQLNLFPRIKPADFFSCFLPSPCGDVEGKILLMGGCDEHCFRGILALPPSLASSFQSDTPWI